MSENEDISNQQAACLAGALPQALCQTQLPDTHLDACATSLGITQPISNQGLYLQAREKYALAYGDISSACINFLHIEISRQQALQDFENDLIQTAACLNNPNNCQLTPLPSLDAYQNAIQQCASAINWARATNTPAEQQALIEYLLVAAPWQPVTPLPTSCNALLSSMLVSNDWGTQYWLVLGETLADKQK